MISGGIDEVGWGALAGPIISVVATFREKDLALLPPGVTDSKKVTKAKRESLYLFLCEGALDIGIGHAWPWEIDRYGAEYSLQVSYRRALGDLKFGAPDLLYVDGSNAVKGFSGRQSVRPKADLYHKEVSAASIIAKVFRDRMMESYAKQFPQYRWNVNSGYGTEDHQQAIEKFGLLVDETNLANYLHRKLYCRKLLERMRLRDGTGAGGLSVLQQAGNPQGGGLERDP